MLWRIQKSKWKLVSSIPKMTIVWRQFHQYRVLLICAFSHIRSYRYVTIICEVLFNSWDDFFSLFLQIPAEAAPAKWRWLLRCWRWFLRYSCKSYHLPGMLSASAAQVCQRVSIVWLSLLFLFAQVDAHFFALSDARRTVRRYSLKL